MVKGKEETVWSIVGVDCMTIIIYDVDDTSSQDLADIAENILAENNISGYTIEKCICQDELEEYPDIALLFVDISLKKENGMDVICKLKEKKKTIPIVFVTDTTNFVIESYDMEAFGYLMKPIQTEKVHHIMDKFLKLSEKYVVRDTRGNEKLKVPLQNIEYFESKNTMIMLHLVNGQQIRTYGKLGNIEKELEHKNFLRCHQSYLINMEHISGIAEAYFVMDSGKNAYIRKRDYTTMKKLFDQYIVNR